MRAKLLGIAVLSLAVLAGSVTDAQAGRRVRVFGEKSSPAAKEAQAKPGKQGEKPYTELIKDKVKVEGLFTFYRDTTDNSWLMSIKPDQFGPIYLCGQTRSAAEGAFFDNGSMGESFPFYFRRVGKNIHMMEKNLRIQADTASSSHKAVQKGISDHLWASAAVKSLPQDSTGEILVDVCDLFLQDAQNLSYFLGQAAQMGVRFDSKNSYCENIKSFPQNSEMDVRLHYATSKPIDAETMQNPYSMFHTIHYSLSALPETDYVPRLADDRVGYFMTMYMDYTDMDNYSPYVRYINRWNLKKKNPEARISEPVEPIVFYVENTWPEEYRDAVAEGIEFWNKAYERIGYRNAIIAKQMPDTADWDPADVRFNTVRWMVMPGGGYAVGPSRANPFTGQIYDADIRVSADFLRYMFNNMEYFIKPVSFDGSFPEEENPLAEYNKHHDVNHYGCNYAEESALEAATGLTFILSGVDDLANKDALTKEYVHAYIVELVAHEVGHTLGFRHNYKASAIYTLEQLQNPEFTKVHSTSGTVMDYCPPNIAGPGQKQGEFYASTPGPYDYWVIEYGYADYGATTPQEEWAELQKVAGRAADPTLAYGTDEDAFGTSTRGIDPQCLTFDHGNDGVKFCEHRLSLTKHLWLNTIKNFERDGEGYQTVLRAFSTGWRAYFEAAGFVSRYIGGIYHNRYHVGDTTGVTPFTPVPAAEQRRAMDFLKKHVFAADAFDLPAELVNKLQPERHWDFSGAVFSMPQIDYPLHESWLAVQNSTLNRLYDPILLGRLRNNVERYAPSDDKYTMYDMFTDVRQTVWSEMANTQNVNSYRRQLQLLHLKRLTQIYLSESAAFPADARTLAANDLDILEGSAKRALGAGSLDGMSQAHYKEVLRQIEAAKNAQKEYSRM